MKTLNELLGWSKWKSIGTQSDSWRKTQYEVFQKVNKRTGLHKYKKIKIVHAACHDHEAFVIAHKEVKK